jgi:hypothetical protein
MKREVARRSTRVSVGLLAAGVGILTAIRIAGSFRAETTLAIEAVLSLALGLTRHIWEKHIMEEWEASAAARVIRHGVT